MAGHAMVLDYDQDHESAPATITKHGKAKVMIVPVPEAGPKLTKETFFGWAAGTVTIPEDLDLTAPTWGDDWIEARDRRCEQRRTSA
jgi:antitoxin (DNA-binding transcriptional repressor) of toxin-antitoxin stability system